MLLGLAVAMLAVSCSQDTTEDVVVNPDALTVGVTLPELTRTELGDKVGQAYPTLWCEGDKIAISGVVSEPLPAAEAGKASAKFTFNKEALPSYPTLGYVAVYPSTFEAMDMEEANIPATQAYEDNSFAHDAAFMFGTSSDLTSVSLQHLCAFIKVPLVKGSDVNVTSVKAVATGGENLSGVADFDFMEPEIYTTKKASADVTVNNIAWNADGEANVILSVIPGNLSQGLTVTIALSDGTEVVKTAYAATGKSLKAGVVLSMPAVQVGAKELAPDAKINNLNDLAAFAAAVAAGDYSAYVSASDGEVNVGADLDLTGVPFTPLASWAGVLDGQGFAIKNWTTNDGLITSNSGVVKNIVLDKSCVLTLPELTENILFGFIVDTNSGVVSGCVNNADIYYTGDSAYQYKAGALVGYSKNETEAGVVNCVNNGNITLSFGSLTGGSYYFGGVVGNTSGTTDVPTVTNCNNTGDITLVVSTASKNMYLGGISGASNSAGIIDGCKNTGKVYYEYTPGGSGAYPNVGGIVGYTACMVKNCNNDGAVTLYSANKATAPANAISRPNIGGVCGYVSKAVDNCHNTAAITVTGSFQAGSGSSNGSQSAPCFGGVCGSCGTSTKNKPGISNCTNRGEVVVDACGVPETGGTKYYTGGVAGWMAGNADNCHNYAKIHVKEAGHQSYNAGCFGFSNNNSSACTISNCTNEGSVTFDKANPKVGGEGSRSYAAGIVGSYEGAAMMENCVNRGAITTNSNTAILMAGLCGGWNGTMNNCANYGKVTMNNATSAYGKSAMGGLIGYANVKPVTNCANYGEIVNASEAGTGVSAGLGCVGDDTGASPEAPQRVDGVTIDCKITAPEGAIVGLVAAMMNAAETYYAFGSAENPIKVSANTTINGVAITAADLADYSKLVSSEWTATDVVSYSSVLF